MPEPPRRCSTCRHFQPAPLWRKGWCRNPLLYAPHQNHLVDERELDCHRQFGDYWEPVDQALVATAGRSTATAPPPPAVAGPTPASAPEGEPAPTPQAAAEVGASVQPPPLDPLPSRPHPGRTSRPDSLRLAVPAVIIGVLLLGYLLWTGLLVREAADSTVPTATVLAAAPATAPAALSPTATPTSVATVAPTPRPATPTVAAVSPTVATTPTRQATPTGIRVGGVAIVDTGSNDGLRMRRDPGQAGVVLRSIRNGERLTLLDGPRDVDGITWWKALYGGDEGWVASQFIKPAQ